jgi:transposase
VRTSVAHRTFAEECTHANAETGWERIICPSGDQKGGPSPSSCDFERRTAELAPALLELPGCAALTAAKLLAEIGPIDRFQSDAQLARHSGVAPLEASSGRTQRHRLDRGGNRQLNTALYRIAITQARCYAPARDYLERKRAEGKSRREAIRCLKRQLARVIFNTLKRAPP